METLKPERGFVPNLNMFVRAQPYVEAKWSFLPDGSRVLIDAHRVQGKRRTRIPLEEARRLLK